MNFQQLRIVRETVKRDFNLTEVADALCTSQSGVSKQLKELECELGVELFVRRGKRLMGLTAPGQEMVEVVERILLDAQNLRRLAAQFAHRDEGSLCVVTTHTQARYALPPVVKSFKHLFPKVHLMLRQVSPDEIVRMLRAGEADIGIATQMVDEAPDLVTFPYYRWHHALVVPDGHPLAALPQITLEAIADYPIITYQEGLTGRAKIDRAFAMEGLLPDIVMSAMDADVIKAYVEIGMGIGIIASMAFDARRDKGLKLLDGASLFEPNTARLAIRRGHYLPGFAYRFIEQCSPTLSELYVKRALALSGETEGVEQAEQLAD